ncbi:hypothetical protein WP5S18E01_22540 [Enterobacter cloacae]|nr:hypothetical protein WP5S18E01_22540 [Enterobacter cloacae]
MTKLTQMQCGICAECVPQVGGGSGFTNCADAHAEETAGDKMHFTKEQLIELTSEDVQLWRERDELIPSLQTAMRLRQAEIALAVLTAPVPDIDALAAEIVENLVDLGGTNEEAEAQYRAWVHKKLFAYAVTLNNSKGVSNA